VTTGPLPEVPELWVIACLPVRLSGVPMDPCPR
jgi:hypothetical protein